MIIFNIKTLLQQKSFKEKKRYTYYDIEDATCIKYITLSRINSTVDYNVRTKDIEKLCNYFNCTPNDLITIYPDEKPE